MLLCCFCALSCKLNITGHRMWLSSWSVESRMKRHWPFTTSTRLCLVFGSYSVELVCTTPRGNGYEISYWNDMNEVIFIACAASVFHVCVSDMFSICLSWHPSVKNITMTQTQVGQWACRAYSCQISSREACQRYWSIARKTVLDYTLTVHIISVCFCLVSFCMCVFCVLLLQLSRRDFHLSTWPVGSWANGVKKLSFGHVCSLHLAVPLLNSLCWFDLWAASLCKWVLRLAVCASMHCKGFKPPAASPRNRSLLTLAWRQVSGRICIYLTVFPMLSFCCLCLPRTPHYCNFANWQDQFRVFLLPFVTTPILFVHFLPYLFLCFKIF